MQEEEGDGRADEDDGQVALLGSQVGGAAAVLVPQDLPPLCENY